MARTSHASLEGLDLDSAKSAASSQRGRLAKVGDGSLQAPAGSYVIARATQAGTSRQKALTVLRCSANRFLAAGFFILSGHGAAAQALLTPVVSYTLEGSLTPQQLALRFSPEQVRTLEVLNRADVLHLPTLKKLVVPNSWQDDLRTYSPFPLHNTAWGSDLLKLLIVHQPTQAFAAYESGQLVRWGPVSTGRQQSQTPGGLFHLNWRSPGRHSTVDPSWFLPWYFNFENERGLSFHEYGLPGRPASHAGVRLLERDARWLFEWGEGWSLDGRGWNVLAQGTPVLILGCYTFDREPPWQSAAWLATGIELEVSPSLEQRSCSSATRSSSLEDLRARVSILLNDFRDRIADLWKNLRFFHLRANALSRHFEGPSLLQTRSHLKPQSSRR